ncbi:hypothetical protein [Methanothermobacter wolfeii]|uniref:hypothetical protein n=1 Tax=Methanothermobacter wolfeii TaxID=145261 RepID=UPI0024B345EC|nr:hypothetical protein [Methanothermobacter wolfeii]
MNIRECRILIFLYNNSRILKGFNAKALIVKIFICQGKIEYKLSLCIYKARRGDINIWDHIRIHQVCDVIFEEAWSHR